MRKTAHSSLEAAAHRPPPGRRISKKPHTRFLFFFCRQLRIGRDRLLYLLPLCKHLGPSRVFKEDTVVFDQHRDVIVAIRIQLRGVLLRIHRPPARVQHSQCFHDGAGKSSEVADVEGPCKIVALSVCDSHKRANQKSKKSLQDTIFQYFDLASREIDTLAIELGGRSIYLNGLFRCGGASFNRYFATLALFIFFHLATPGCYRERFNVEVALIYLKWIFPISWR
jgi:hypothetical protein